MSLADRIAVIHQGVLQQIGTPHEIYNRPQSLFVAGFMGMPTMNLHDAELTTETAHLFYVSVIPMSISTSLQNGKRVSRQMPKKMVWYSVSVLSISQPRINRANGTFRHRYISLNLSGQSTSSICVSVHIHKPRTPSSSAFGHIRHSGLR